MEVSTIEIQAVGLTTRKAHGEAAEGAFLAKAASLGFGVARVWGDSERYDFILDSGQKLWRVQVKSTRRFVDSHYVVKCRGNNRRYAAGEIDFMAAYIVPKNLWYVIPISVAELHPQIYFFPQCASSRAICEIYREAWCQMSCPRDGPTCIHLARRCQTESGAGSCKLREPSTCSISS